MHYRDDVSGWATPVFYVDNEFRKKLIARLAKMMPTWIYDFYVFTDGTTSVLINDNGEPSWAWWLPKKITNSHWLVTVEDFLVYEIIRLGGRIDDL